MRAVRLAAYQNLQFSDGSLPNCLRLAFHDAATCVLLLRSQRCNAAFITAACSFSKDMANSPCCPSRNVNQHLPFSFVLLITELIQVSMLEQVQEEPGYGRVCGLASVQRPSCSCQHDDPGSRPIERPMKLFGCRQLCMRPPVILASPKLGVLLQCTLHGPPGRLAGCRANMFTVWGGQQSKRVGPQ